MRKTPILFTVILIIFTLSACTTEVAPYNDTTVRWEEEDIPESPSGLKEAHIPKEASAYEESKEIKIIYITASGKKFHLEGCASLAKSKIEISYEDALNKGFTPCEKCKP